MPIFYMAFGVFTILIGILYIKKPEFAWKITEGWKHNDDNGPSDSYLILSQIGGIICVVAGGLSFIYGILTLLRDTFAT
ncbi:hypothetical protein J2Z32_002177 [Paenibacillus turicensis]|uniref:DUF6199 domain-containing protein n=2 Tax=Paenibacillus turicensis TaxID=160487 RepID=A0ABS4FSK1_9BACL|nr:hypothetical protein [Paenibacillus turicensis]